MSANDPQTPPVADPPVTRARNHALSSPWGWMTLACLLLGASGGVRAWQDYRFSTLRAAATMAPPFPLKELPRTLGEWRTQAGSEITLDPQIARIAGSTDHVIRTYTHDTTKQSVSVLILFGPAQEVFGHRPEVCYPSAGYQQVAETLARTIASGAAHPAEFFAQVYGRRQDPQQMKQEVYFSFRRGDRWSPDQERFWREFRHDPSMFKVQVQRLVTSSERREDANPTEQFLALLVPEIERRMVGAPRNPER